MKPRTPWFVVLASFVGCGAPEGSPRPELAEAEPRRLLVVHSYHADYEWTAGLQRGLERAFAGADDVEVGTYYMDTKRNPDKAHKVRAGELALTMTNEWAPSVVVTTDDNAQEYFGRHLVGRDDLQVVFCGVNADPDRYGMPASNVTGTLERPVVGRSVELLDRMAPGKQRIAYVGDTSPTSESFLGFFLQELPADRLARPVTVSTFREWKQAIRELPRRADAVALNTYHTLLDDDGRAVEPRAVMEWTNAHLDLPSVAFTGFAVEDGALLGYIVSPYEIGHQAGTWALELLGGAPITRFPVVPAVDGQTMVNLGTVSALGLPFDDDTLADFDVRVGEAP